MQISFKKGYDHESFMNYMMSLEDIRVCTILIKYRDIKVLLLLKRTIITAELIKSSLVIIIMIT